MSLLPEAAESSNPEDEDDDDSLEMNGHSADENSRHERMNEVGRIVCIVRSGDVTWNDFELYVAKTTL